MGLCLRQKTQWIATSRSPDPAARIANHSSRCLLHLVLITIETPPFLGADRIVNSDKPNGSESV